METIRPEITQRLKKIGNLPTIPAVTSRILKIVSSNKSNAQDLANLIKTDPSLTVRVLKMVNSAYYGMSSQISTVDRAVVILGFNTIKSLALSASVFTTLQSTQEHVNFSYDKLWEHCIGVGVIADIIAKSLGLRGMEEVFVAGIVHDVGKIIIGEFLPDEFDVILTYMEKENWPMYKAEQHVLNFDHTEVGFHIACQWKFPDNIVYGIRYHHDPEKSPADNKSASIIYFANLICKAKNIGFGGDDIIPEISEGAKQRLNIDEKIFKNLLMEVGKKINEIEEIKNISMG